MISFYSVLQARTSRTSWSARQKWKARYSRSTRTTRSSWPATDRLRGVGHSTVQSMPTWPTRTIRTQRPAWKPRKSRQPWSTWKSRTTWSTRTKWSSWSAWNTRLRRREGRARTTGSKHERYSWRPRSARRARFVS